MPSSITHIDARPSTRIRLASGGGTYGHASAYGDCQIAGRDQSHVVFAADTVGSNEHFGTAPAILG
jgi:hypothetical protein